MNAGTINCNGKIHGTAMVVDTRQYLMGIRSGSHWSESKFPAKDYPHGAPESAVWDLQSNTNFGLSIDADIMQELQGFTRNLEQFEAKL